MATSARRICRQVGNSRIGFKLAIILIIGLLCIHTFLLFIVRHGLRLSSSEHYGGQTDRKRDVSLMPSGHSVEVTPSQKRTTPIRVRETEHLLPVAAEVESVNLHDVVKNLGRLHRTTPVNSIEQGNEVSNKRENKVVISSSSRDNSSPEVLQANASGEVRTTSSRKSCVRYVSFYTPRMEPFKYWREYVNLNEAFKEAKVPDSIFYDSRITQRREFPTMFIECPGYRCDVALRPTADETFLARSDAVLINMTPQELRYKMPQISERLMKILPRRVKVFFYGMECPLMMSHWDPTIKDIKYHYTMTYHSDSDVHFPYGRYVAGPPTDDLDKETNFAENKTGILVWTASNCHNTFWPRLEWVRRLNKLMPFDIYGKCGTKTCLPPLSPNCTKSQSVYKFYLALENAPCDEYISEKFWVNSLLNGVVPLVYGGKREAYERVAPPNSFIHVSDFSSQQELVDYLHMVDKNDNLYNEFFAWRKQGKVERIYPDLYPNAFCRVLPKLSKYSAPPVKRIGDSTYFQGCRGGYDRNFTQDGDLENWVPWR